MRVKLRGLTGRGSQQGMASFLIVMIMMLVITLIVLGFSQVTRRNQREALDRQLSSQALYAAESGANVTTATLTNYVAANGYSTLPTKTSCADDYDATNGGGTGTAITDLSAGVRYTCVLVNPNPSTLTHPLQQQQSVVMPINTASNLKSLTFNWTTKPNGTDKNCTGGASAQSFPKLSDWTCDYGILRVDLLANPNGNVSNLAGNAVTIYMSPLGNHTGAITIPGFTGDRAFAVSASSCTGTTCTATVTFSGGAQMSSYAARITSLYQDSSLLTISGTLASGDPAAFSGAQAVVDTTGQAQDELRRIQVRVALTATPSADNIPQNAVGSTATICKHFTILPSANVDPTALCE